MASVAPAFGATTGGFGAATSQPSTGMFGAPAPAFGATTGGFGAATSQVSCHSCHTSFHKAVVCSLEDCSAPLVNPPPLGQPTPHQGSGDLEHRQTSNLTRTSDSSELLTIRTSQPPASEDSGFGQPTSSAPSTFGSTGCFGAATSQAGGLFGAQNKPATGFGGFGQPTSSAPSAFGANGVFGANTGAEQAWRPVWWHEHFRNN